MRIFFGFLKFLLFKHIRFAYTCVVPTAARTRTHTRTIVARVYVCIDQFLLKCNKIRRFSFAVCCCCCYCCCCCTHFVKMISNTDNLHLLLWKKVAMRSEVAALMQEIAVLIVFNCYCCYILYIRYVIVDKFHIIISKFSKEMLIRQKLWECIWKHYKYNFHIFHYIHTDT